MHRILCMIVLCSLGCGEPWNPAGTYELIQVWQGGDCRLTVPRPITLTISPDREAPSGYTVGVTEPGVQLDAGELLAFDDRCEMNFTLSEPSGVGLPFIGNAFSLINITERDGDIQGNGSINVGSPDNCSQTFTVEGMKIE